MLRACFLLLVAAVSGFSQVGQLRGFATDAARVFAWGDGAYLWTSPTAKPSRIAKGIFSEGGCVWDVDGDGLPDLVLNETQPEMALVWYKAPKWERRVISKGVDSLDLLGAKLLGHRGILAIHKRMQVRFYELNEAWRETELYSFYTPSHEGGIQLADINQGGRMDILVGNYWMASPASWELPWHLFAIDTWTEREESAQLSLGWVDRHRIAAQRSAKPARLAWFDIAEDPKQLWPAHFLGENLALDSIVVAAESIDRFVVAERAGQGRIFLFQAGKPKLLRAGKPVVGISLLTPKDLLVIEQHGISTRRVR